MLYDGAHPPNPLCHLDFPQLNRTVRLITQLGFALLGSAAVAAHGAAVLMDRV
jgi:hypothetical protein